jgi:glycosyltransferase involved in cell wall biosynthesis
MRILLIGETKSLFGGGEIYVSRLESLLDRKGHDVKWWAPSSSIPNNSDEIKAVWNPKHAKMLASVITDFRPDIIHIHGFMHRLSGSILLKAKHEKIPLILTLHDFNMFCPRITLIRDGPDLCDHRFPNINCFGSCLYRDALKNIIRYPRLFINQHVVRCCLDVITAPSKLLTEIATNFFQKIHCNYVPNFLPSSLPELSSKNRRNSHQFCYMGRLHETKGVHFLIRAMSLLRKQGILTNLVICGSGPQESDLKNHAHELRFQENINFLGQQSHDVVWNILKKSAALVVPSSGADNSPLVIYEALAANTPVIASRIGGLPDLVDDNETGFLFKPGDVNELSEKMQTLLQLEEEKKELMANKIFKKAQTFTEERHYDLIMQAYSTCIEKKIVGR